MNNIAKCFAVVAIITFGLSACGGESSGESTGSMGTTQLDLSRLSAAAVAGHAIYEDPSQGCMTCHGQLGQGTAAGGPVDNTTDCPSCTDHTTLTAYNDALMPSTTGGYSPGACIGQCASDVSQYIIEGFIQGLVLPGANNNPAINVNPTSGLTTTEAGGLASFTVALNSLPTDDVTVNLTSDNTAEGMVNPSTLTFTTANWTQPQTVMVTGVDDALLDGNVAYTIVTAAATSADTNYNGIDPADVSVTNTDDEIPPPGVITVNPTSGLVTDENGATATFTIVLGTVPTANVSIGLSSSNAAEGTVSPASVVFNAGNYNVAQTVTVTGVDDAANPMVDGNIAYSVVTAPAISNDLSYTGLDASDVAVTNNDNDVQPVIANFSADPVSNAGAPIPYAGMVTLNWTSDGDACTAGGATAGGQWTGALLASGSQTLTNLTTSGVNTFTLICTKGGINSAVSTVDVTVAAQPGAPTVTLTANPTMNVPYNGSTTLTWSTVDATTCSATSNPANPAWDNANKALNEAVGQVITNLTAATNAFSLSCTNAGGLITTATVNVTVIQPNPSVTLTANPTIVGEGAADTTLTWTTTDLASCTASANPTNAQWTGAKGVLATQSQAITGLTETTTFTLNCVGTNAAAVTSSSTVTFDVTSTGQYLYNTETFGGVLNQTCADSQCHGTPANPGIYEPFYPIFDKTALCTKYPTNALLLQKLVDTMPSGFDANQQFISVNCDATCSTKIMNYMFLNFYPGNTTDCEGGALPLPIP